jgi:L-ascorbate metabolism protein UlaG (beta-lactamase superfamily)
VIHFDPGYTGYFKNQGIPVNTFEEKAGLVLISHFHKDHLQPEALDRIVECDTQIIAPESCMDRINRKFTAVKPGDQLFWRKVKIKSVNAYNTTDGHSVRKVHHKGLFVGYLVYLEDKCVYFAGDTDYIPEMSKLGQVDIAFLPVGGTFVMDIEEAAKAAIKISPHMVFPMHQSGNDPGTYKRKLADQSHLEVIVLKAGEKITI